MNADRVISKINYDMNAFNESGSRKDKACAEGLRRARTYVQQEVLKRKILTHDQQVVLEWLKEAYKRTKWSSPFGTVYSTINTHELFVRTRLTKAQQFQVLAAFANYGLEGEG